MSTWLSAKAFILKTQKFSEADLIVLVLTSKGEKIRLLAKAALKSKKRFGGGVLEPTHYVEINYQKSKSINGFPMLSEAKLIEPFEGLRSDYDKLNLSFYILNCIGKVGQEGDAESSSLFDLVGNSLKALQEAKDLNLFKIHFSLKLLYQQGVLEAQNWMKPFLQTPIARHSSIESSPPSMERFYYSLIDQQLEQYLKHAE